MLCVFVMTWVLLDGMGEHIPFWVVAGLWSITYFVTLIPISINGYGVQELSLTYLLSSAAGLGATLSLAVAIMIRVLYMLASLPGAAFLPGILAAMDKGPSTDRKQS